MLRFTTRIAREVGQGSERGWQMRAVRVLVMEDMLGERGRPHWSGTLRDMIQHGNEMGFVLYACICVLFSFTISWYFVLCLLELLSWQFNMLSIILYPLRF